MHMHTRALHLLLITGLATLHACTPAPQDTAAPPPPPEEVPETSLDMHREISGDPHAPNSPLDVHITLHYTSEKPVQALEVTEQLPENWSFLELDAQDRPDIYPAEGAQGEIRFVWLKVEAFPLHLNYRIQTSDTPPTPAHIHGQTTYQSTGPEVASEIITTHFDTP